MNPHHPPRDGRGGEQSARPGRLPVTISPDVARRFVTADGNIRRSVVAADVQVNGRLRCSVAFPGAHIGDGADVSESVLLPGSRVPDGARLHRAIVLEDGTVHEVQPTGDLETKP